jgi:hypothetical protein
MEICKFWFKEVGEGIHVPGYHGTTGIVHRECLAAAALKLAETPR